MARKAQLTDANKVFIVENINLDSNTLAKKLNKPINLIEEYLSKIKGLRSEAENIRNIEEKIKESKKPIQYPNATVMTEASSSQPIHSPTIRDKPWISRHN